MKRFSEGLPDVRPTIYVAAALALLAFAPETSRSLLVCAASVVLESLPYLIAGTMLAPLLGRYARALTALAGCGCGDAPGALSLPAAAATALLFGPWVAIARFALAALLHMRLRGNAHEHHRSLWEDVHRLAPSAGACAIVVVVLPRLDLSHVSTLVLFLGGALAGALATPCALGGVALAASLHAHAPFAAYGVLCTTGMFNALVRGAARAPCHPEVLRKAKPRRAEGRLSYFMLALACALVAWEHGAALVHPRMAIPLAACAVVCVWLSIRSRGDVPLTHVALPIAMLVAIVIGAPSPTYSANENTMSDLYPGERLSFTGAYSNGVLVRYAITCCRADAAPVAIRLARSIRAHEHSWIHANGTIVRDGSTLALDVAHIDRLTPPSDPFLYR